eukprot:CAMPEP_0203971600 /NCGR_PEP_ID=MMETSP0359-20131031/98559_1 /ASSEMBLY_ACC=CAM_ASM_000338 /TAXON_ID=268821 /ORGANISM="Scrippsiella Hangoei, Strain SHTV-5" /LENGTH=586 /DNA_ID=CAMNT_0050909583 /DNA_START=62 /DNA_END=1822 /DNA_ORIENTATION=+
MSSDEEMPPMGAGGMGMDDDSDGGMDDAGADGPILPEGVKKEIITASEGFKRPKKGDEVTVHYVGTLTDGTEFDSSRKKDKPFVFPLGKGQVIKGWDLGVATMLKGEVAKFTIASEFGYGESGSPPTIPPNASLVFEVELISWASKDDLFGDEGVIKTTLEGEGKGWKKPSDGDEVRLTLKAEAADGSVMEERKSIEYVVGSDALGPLAKAVDMALAGMRKNESVSLKCAKEYAYGEKHPDGATITLALEEIYETKDMSFGKDGSVMKKQTQEGEGFDRPKDGVKATLAVTAATDGAGAALPGFKAATIEFTVGDGEVCDALECAVGEMKKGEKAVLTASASSAAETKLGLQDVKEGKIVLTIELQEFEKKKEIWDMSEEEKVEFGTARKEVGSQLLKAGRYELALQKYKKVGEAFSFVDNYKEENKGKAKALKQACELNKSAVYLKLQDWTEAKNTCNSILKDDKENIKAIFRRAQAQLHLKNFQDCMNDCKKVVELDSQNKEARALLKLAQAGQKEEDKQAKGLFANMCKALGKGPIPAPGKADKIGEFSDEEDAPMDAQDDEAEEEGAKEEGQAAEEGAKESA